MQWILMRFHQIWHGQIEHSSRCAIFSMSFWFDCCMFRHETDRKTRRENILLISSAYRISNQILRSIQRSNSISYIYCMNMRQKWIVSFVKSIVKFRRPLMCGSTPMSLESICFPIISLITSNFTRYLK